jgi:hypothetical protein
LPATAGYAPVSSVSYNNPYFIKIGTPGIGTDAVYTVADVVSNQIKRKYGLSSVDILETAGGYVNTELRNASIEKIAKELNNQNKASQSFITSRNILSKTGNFLAGYYGSAFGATIDVIKKEIENQQKLEEDMKVVGLIKTAGFADRFELALTPVTDELTGETWANMVPTAKTNEQLIALNSFLKETGVSNRLAKFKKEHKNFPNVITMQYLLTYPEIVDLFVMNVMESYERDRVFEED